MRLALLIAIVAGLAVGQSYDRYVDGEYAGSGGRPKSVRVGGYTVHGPSDAQLAEAGYYRIVREPVPAGFSAGGWERAGIVDGVSLYRAVDLVDEAAVEQARIVALAAAYGPLIGRLQQHLVALGHSLPADSAAVIGDVVGRSAAGALTPEQEVAKGNAIDLYVILSGKLNDADINAVWTVIGAGQ